jgi:hypothetical protein
MDSIKQPHNSFVLSKQTLNQCYGNKQLPFSSSSNQNIQFKNPTLIKIETLNPKSKDKIK